MGYFLFQTTSVETEKLHERFIYFFQKAAANPPGELGRPVATLSQFSELVNKDRHPQVISIILNYKLNLKTSKEKLQACENF